MVELFGVDIAEVVADAIEAAGNLQAGTLMPVGTEDSHSFQGFVAQREDRDPQTRVVRTRLVMSILGASLPNGVVPGVNDLARIGSITYELSGLISVDPAQAVYEFEVS